MKFIIISIILFAAVFSIGVDAALTKINITPSNPIILKGFNQQLNAQTLDQFGNPISAILTWSSSNNGTGTINSATGLFTALAPGSSTIKAISGTVFGSTTATVNSVATKEDCTKKLTEYVCQGSYSVAKVVWSCKTGQGNATSCNIGQCISKVGISGWKFCSKGCNTLTGKCKI